MKKIPKQEYTTEFKEQAVKQVESPRVLWRLFGLSNFGRIQVG
ncbi:hypothetical protein Nit79A3_1346 [Nitrosomonas sp. Is79A3]